MTGFFNTATRPERDPSRPRFVNPKTGTEQSWQRASNFAAPLESPFGMIKHKTRQLVRGLNRRVDLARMLLTGAVIEDKVDEVIATALTASEDEAKANNGTAVHAALGLCDSGADVPQEYWSHAQGYVAELKRYGLRPVALEQRVLNTHLGATGTFDRVYVTDSGRYLIGDIKTGSLSHPHGYGVQCEVYAGADFIVHPDGTTEPIPWRLDQDAALIIHVDPETGATSIYEVPLRVARWGAALAEQVRAFQRTDILLPYSGAPAGPLAEELRREAVQAVAQAAEMPAELVTPPPGVPNAEQIQAATQQIIAGVDPDARLAARGSDAAQPQELTEGELTTQELTEATKLKIVERGQANIDPAYVRRMLVLMAPKNDKAKLQKMLHDLGGRDLNHHRRWLADAIIRAQNSRALSPGAEASGAAPQQVPPSAAEIAQTVEASTPAAEATPFLLKQLSEAASVEDLDRIRDNIIRQSGPHAWTQAMSDVANTRAAELQAWAQKALETSPLSRIADAKSTQDLALIWSDVTANGTKVAAWTPAYDKAANEKAAQLAAAVQSAPVNPWGTQ